MKSIGILYKAKANDGPQEVVGVKADLHINYWKLPNGGSEYSRFMDIGIMIYECGGDIDSLILYFPFIVNKEDLHDLGKQISENNLLCALFGADYETSSGKSVSYTYAKTDTESKQSFWLYELGESNFTITTKDKGTIVEIKIKTSPKNIEEIKEGEKNDKNGKYNLYVRFRLDNLSNKGVHVCESISNDFLQSAFSKKEIINFAINDKHDIYHSDYQDLAAKGNFFQFNKFHFFFVASSDDETISGSTKYIDCNPLDPDVWNSYINGHNPLNKTCFAHHWEIEAKKKNPKIFLSTIYSSYDKKRIAKYLAVACGLSYIASLLYDITKPIYMLLLNLVGKWFGENN